MASRPALALVRPRPRAGLRAPSGRVLAIAGALVGLLVLLYLGARHTPVFAVEEIEVRGAPPRVRDQVRAAAGPTLGTSLVALDGSELVERLEALPTVRVAAYDRAFPSTLRIDVAPERPVAVVRTGSAAWVVSDGGRVVRPAGARTSLPRIRAKGVSLSPGAIVADARVRTPLAALDRLPKGFPVAVRAARIADGRITLVLAGETELRLGEAVDLRLKLTVAERVLATLSREERRGLAYLDVSLPERPVAAAKPQVEG